eukprot:140337-Pleurochrysis_carterae.AAC.2
MKTHWKLRPHGFRQVFERHARPDAANGAASGAIRMPVDRHKPNICVCGGGTRDRTAKQGKPGAVGRTQLMHVC